MPPNRSGPAALAGAAEADDRVWSDARPDISSPWPMQPWGTRTAWPWPRIDQVGAIVIARIYPDG
jgi:hypothetical protein